MTMSDNRRRTRERHRAGIRLVAANAVLAALAFASFSTGGSARSADWEWTAGHDWVQGAGDARPTPGEQILHAYELEKRGEFMDSARQYFLLIRSFPDSREAGIGLQRLARCLFEMESYWAAYKAIEQVIETYPHTGDTAVLAEIELRIAKKIMLSRAALKTPDALAEDVADVRGFNIRHALRILDSVIEHAPHGRAAAETHLVRGEGLFFIDEAADARKAFETVLADFPFSDSVERARLGVIACDLRAGRAGHDAWQRQVEVVREAERKRSLLRSEVGETKDAELPLGQLSDAVAAKMMEWIDRYPSVEDRGHVQSAGSPYKTPNAPLSPTGPAGPPSPGPRVMDAGAPGENPDM